MKPEVSVVVTLYKRPQYLAPLMESVFAQTLSNWELIFVDDGSDMPELTEMCRRYEQQDSRVRYIQLPQNSGLSVARNRGIAEAVADYIAFLDDDDFYHPTFLQKHVTYLQQNPQVARVGSYGTAIDKNGHVLPQYFPPEHPEPLVYLSQTEPAVIKTEGATGKACFCRNYLVEIGGYDADFPIGEEIEIDLRLLDKYPIAVWRERLSFWRSHGAAHLSQHPNLWKYVAAGYIAAYHRRNNIPEPSGVRPFNLLVNLKLMPTDVISATLRKARSSIKRLLRAKKYAEMENMLNDFHAAFSFNKKYYRKMHRNLLLWCLCYGKFGALPTVLRSIR